MKNLLSLALLGGLLLGLAGCGQKGPLYLPDAQEPAQQGSLPSARVALSAPDVDV